MTGSVADSIWNRAALHLRKGPLATGDLALMAMLRTHGLVMNGGVLNCVEIMAPEEFEKGLSGYRFFGLNTVSDLLVRAQRLLTQEGADLGSQEQSLDAEYARLIPSDSFLFSVFKEHLRVAPASYAPIDESEQGHT